MFCNIFYNRHNHCVPTLFIHTFHRNIGKIKRFRKSLQGKTFLRCNRSDSKVVFYNRHTIIPSPHIGFKRKRNTVFAFLNTVIRKSIYLIFVRYSGVHLLILYRILIKIKAVICFYASVDNIKYVLFERLLFRKLKFITHIKILKSDDICSRSVLRYSVVASIRNEISYIIIPIGKLIVYAVKGFAVIVFGKISDIFKENNFRLFSVCYSHYFKEKITSFIGETFFVTAYRERLTRKSRGENIKIRYIICVNFSYITFG